MQCPHFDVGECRSCPLMGVPYARQLADKQAAVLAALADALDADTVVGEVALGEVDGRALDAGAAEVDAEGMLHEANPIRVAPDPVSALTPRPDRVRRGKYGARRGDGPGTVGG